MALTDAQAKIINRNKKKKEEAKKKASTYSNTTVSSKNKLSTGSQLSPLDLMKKDAATKTTVRDKVNYAKQSGASTNTSKSIQANKEKQAAKSQARSSLTLSESDLKLPSLSQKGILDAKVAWEETKKAGDTEGMAKAHQQAEKIRSRFGYSGGSSGSDYLVAALTQKEKQNLDEDGQNKLKSAKLEREEAIKRGDIAGQMAASEKILSIQNDPFNQRQGAVGKQRLDAHGRAIEQGAMTKEEMQAAEKRFQEGLYSAMAAVPGSLLSTLETGMQAARNFSRDKFGKDIQDYSNEVESLEAKLELAEAGQGNPEWGTVQQLKYQLEVAKWARELANSATTVDPNLPGQTLMRKSQESAEKALEGQTGIQALLTKAGLSAAQMLPGVATSFVPGVGPALGLGIMGAQAAGSKMYDLNEQNAQANYLSLINGGTPEDYGAVSPGQAFVRGVASGAIEALTEKIPLGNLLDIVKKGGSNALVNVAKQAGIEGVEESVSYLLNYYADDIAHDPNAQFSPEEMVESALIGAISGAGFGAGGSVINTAINANRGRTQTTERTGQDILLEAAGVKPPETQQNEPEQTFERPQQETLAQAETPVQAQERGEETTSVNTDPAQHTEVEQDVIDDYQTSVDDAIRDTFQEYFNDPSKGFSRHNISDVSARQAEDASALLGGEYKGYKNAINSNGIRHILKEHGPNGTTDYSFADLNDAARLGYVLGNYDDVKVVSYSSGDADLSAEFRTKDNRPAPMLEFSKKVNGTYYIVEAIPESKHKKFWVVSAYMKKADGGTQAPDAFSPENTPETPLASLPSANSIIAESTESGNPEFEAMGAMSRGGAGQFASWQAESQNFHPINEQAAAVTAEQRGRAQTEIPTYNLEGRLTSKTISTFANANILPNEMVTALENNLADGAYSRLAYTDSQALQDAEAIIEERGFQGAKEYWLTQTANGRINKANSTLGIALINRAANSPSLHVDAMDLLSRYADYAKDAGQALQAMNMINKLTPQGQLYTMVKAIEYLEERAAERGNAVNVEINPELVTAFMEAETQQERNEIKQEMIKDAAAQLPSTWRDRFDSWRYLAMLGNARTHIRNVFGNAGFAVVRGAKNVTASGLERAFGVKDRTTAVLNRFDAEDRARLTVARGEFPQVKELILSGGKYMDDYSQINQERDVWKSDNKLLNAAFKPVSFLSKKNSELLDKEDILFSKPAYTAALARYLKANNITAQEYANMLEGDTRRQEAQAHAIKEAQKATYRDTNDFSEAISRISKWRYDDNKAVRGLGYLAEGVLPFKKTPANILVRAVEYSPVGLGLGIRDAVVSNRADSWASKGEGKNVLSKKIIKLEKDLASNAKTPAEAIDELAAGLTGTGLLGLGMLFAHMGIATGGASDDDKQDDFNELQGHQNYALEIGNRSLTLDWLAPEALPFFVGIEFQKFMQQKKNGEATADDLVSSLMRIADPMLEMSMLQGLNDLFNTIGSDYALSSAAWTAATSYLTQFLPTLAGQIERIGEPVRETTFIDPDSKAPKGMQYLLGNIGNKIPGWDYNQVDYVDAWGRKEETGNLALRAFNNLINPAYYSEIQTGSTEAELMRLHELGYESVLPSSFQKSTEIDGEKVSGDQWVNMQTTRGKTAKAVLDSFIGTEQYNAMTDDERAKFVKKVLEYGSNMGKVKGGAEAEETFARWQEAAKNAKAEVGLSEAEIIAASAYQSVLGEDAGDETKASIKQGMYEQWVNDRTDLNDEQKAYLKNNIKFYQMIPADASSYNKAVEAGYTTPESIEALLSGKKEYDFDGNASYTNTEMYAYISSLPEGEQEMAWNALRSKGTTKSWATLKSEEAPKLAKQQKAQETLNGSMEADRQAVFANAISEYGTGSRYAVYQALMSIDATDAERQTYYNYVNAKKGWKASWAQMKANGGYP